MYNQYYDPSPEDGSYKEWRNNTLFPGSTEINEEIFYKIYFYHPAKHTKSLGLVALGSQSLNEIDKCIYCVCDYMLTEENLNENEPLKSYFFIENVFYYKLHKLDDDK